MQIAMMSGTTAKCASRSGLPIAGTVRDHASPRRRNTRFARVVTSNVYRPELITNVENTVTPPNAQTTNTISQYAYTYDTLGRATARNTDTFAYNARSEVTSAHITPYSPTTYSYDQIGNNLTLGNNHSALNQFPGAFFDLDGNYVGAYQQCAYDSANRFICMVSPFDGSLIYSNAYDHASRRIVKHSPYYTYTFVYDDWNQITEIVRNNANSTCTTNLFVWGKDISGTMQGAGGVGGLLATRMDGTWYYPLYDNNGNITEYVDQNGAIAAQFSYDALGGTISAVGSQAYYLRHRFSTKYYDREDGLYYYGLRFYDPYSLRWLNRDPIEEAGGLNLYAFCRNNAVNKWDYLGWIAVTDIPPIMDANGWTQGATLMRKWLSCPTGTYNPDDTTTITMDWVLGFKRAKTVYDKIFTDKIYMNEAAIRIIKNNLIRDSFRVIIESRIMGDRDAKLKFLDLSLPVPDLHKYHVNNRSVGDNADPLDGLKAALGRFSFYVAIGGNLSCKNGLVLNIKEVGVYLMDSYDFDGFQFLGSWNKKTNHVGNWSVFGADVYNSDFRSYSSKTGMGRNFNVYSDLKTTKLPKPEKIELE